MATSLTFRAAHAWLRGHSDGLAGKPAALPATLQAACEDSYMRGHANGSRPR